MNVVGPGSSGTGRGNWIALWTLYRREVRRFLAVAAQTVLGPVVTTLLFLVVFTVVMAGRGQSQAVGGVPYLVAREKVWQQSYPADLPVSGSLPFRRPHSVRRAKASQTGPIGATAIRPAVPEQQAAGEPEDGSEPLVGRSVCKGPAPWPAQACKFEYFSSAMNPGKLRALCRIQPFFTAD